MAKVLLYNFTEEARRKKVKSVLFRYGLPSREVAAGEQEHPLGALLGLEGFQPAEEADAPFQEEMIVMYGLNPRQFNGFLDGIRALGVQVALKAVVTEHNITWSSRRLRQELMAEREALRGGGSPLHREG